MERPAIGGTSENRESKLIIDNYKKKIEDLLRKKTENSKKAAQLITDMLENSKTKEHK